MNPEAQRIAIAAACGWTYTPDYLNDLNAMHEAEKVLMPDQQDDFNYHLSEIAAPITGERWMCVHATAAQRAEAFLKCLNLWTDTCKTDSKP